MICPLEKCQGTNLCTYCRTRREIDRSKITGIKIAKRLLKDINTDILDREIDKINYGWKFRGKSIL